MKKQKSGLYYAKRQTRRQELRAWWKENAVGLIGALAAVAAAVFAALGYFK